MKAEYSQEYFACRRHTYARFLWKKVKACPKYRLSSNCNNRKPNEGVRWESSAVQSGRD